MKSYTEIIKNALNDGGIYDAMLALQEEEGYLSENAINALSEEFNIPAARVYETASFYSMIRMRPRANTEIRVCRGTACHTSGGKKLIAEIEKLLGIPAGEMTADGEYSFGYVECLGQCQSAPAVLVNGVLHTDMNIRKLRELLGR